MNGQFSGLAIFLVEGSLLSTYSFATGLLCFVVKRGVGQRQVRWLRQTKDGPI